MSKLFYDDEFDALAQTIANSDKEFKECAAFLFPQMTSTSGYSKLKHAVSGTKDEWLTFGQIIALCKFCGQYDALYFMAQELTHDRPQPNKPEDELAGLLRQYLESASSLSKLQPRIEAARDKLKSVG